MRTFDFKRLKSTDSDFRNSESAYKSQKLILEILSDDVLRGSLEFELNHYIGKNLVEEIVPLTQDSEETLTFKIELIEILDDNSVEF